MKNWKPLLLLLTLSLLFTISAAATEAEQVITTETVYSESVSKTYNSSSTLTWNDSYDTYYMQLTEEEQGYYNTIVTAFNAFAANMGTYFTQPQPLVWPAASGNNSWYFQDIVISENVEFKAWRTYDEHNQVIYKDGKEVHQYNDDFYNHVKNVYTKFNRVMKAVVLDHPEFFWIRTDFGEGYSVSYSYYTDGSENSGDAANPYTANGTIYFDLFFNAQPYSDTIEECMALQTALNTSINTILTSVNGMSDHDKLAYFDNWLAANNTYNSAAAEDSQYIDTNETPWSIVGAFLSGYNPVCEGYAKAFQLLCHKSNIPCLQVTGIADNGEGKEGHMWVAVKLDGKWYFSDPTWNDPLYSNGTDAAYSSKNYFLKKWPTSHTIDTDFPFAVPPCSEEYTDERTEIINGFIEDLESDNAATADTWGTSSNGLSGFEVGKGTMLIALYDSNWKMLGVYECDRSQWQSTGWYVYTLPDTLNLTGVNHILRFNIGGTDANRAPIRAKLSISAA